MLPEFGLVKRPPCAANALTFDSIGELLDAGIREFSSDADGNARYFFRGEWDFSRIRFRIFFARKSSSSGKSKFFKMS